ncbi:MAG TPA: transporter substrate-binding domain-containing protein, partial [Synergistaceae bacterium]|nr:transporter substrate-binding domain-containing protein [Synergistaceae bacterium]
MIFVMGGAVSAAPGASLEEIQARGVLRGGVPDFRLYPFAFSENGVLLGFDVDLVQAVADAMKVKLELVPLPWGEVALAWDPSYTWDH